MSAKRHWPSGLEQALGRPPGFWASVRQTHRMLHGWAEMRLWAAKSEFELRTRNALKDLLAGKQRFELPSCQEPLLSIVLVTHNKAHLTATCLASIADQSYRNFETIVVDNASNDETLSVFERAKGLKIIQNSRNIGYTRAVNAGVELARGRYLLLLNNDVVLARSAGASGVAALDADAGKGAVGCRLILPDARLQEAGCIVWRDGRCEGFGRGARNDDAKYLSPRPVDYCSAAAIFVRSTAFRKVGGYHDAYSPAYYEDVDLCVSLWQEGYSVWYVPEAVALHFEFGTTRDRTQYASIIERNREIFIARHSAFLRSKPKRPGYSILRRQSLAHLLTEATSSTGSAIASNQAALRNLPRNRAI